MDLVTLMDAKGTAMNVGSFESFQINGKDYHLERRGSHEFIIEPLS